MQGDDDFSSQISNHTTDRSQPNFQVYKRLGYSSLHLSFEDLPVALQSLFVKHYMNDLENEIKEHGWNRIELNNLNEEVYRYHVNMPIRKIGYASYYSRYNHDKGLAVFEKRQQL